MSDNVKLSDFCRALYSFVELESKLNGGAPDQKLIEKIKLLSAGIFRIVVMGEVKKGKSSFINAMLGVENLVPVSTDVATSTIYKICYGEKQSYKVFFSKESGKESLVIAQSEITKYGTEDGNPGNEKQVDFIQVFVPSSILKSGLVIIDTPGLGGLFKDHKRITYEYVPRADAVFLVTDSVESPIGKAELDLLSDLRGITSQIFFVQTKAAVVDKKTRLARKQNNIQILDNAGFHGAEKQYYLVDSKLKFEADKSDDIEDLVDSGFPLIMALVEQGIKPNVRSIMMQRARLEFKPRIDKAVMEIESRKRMILADTADKRKALQQEIDEAERELQEWDKTKLPDLLDNFQKEISAIRRTAEDTLNECRPGGMINQRLDEKLINVQNVEELQAVNTQIAEKLPAMLSEYYIQVTRKIQEDVEKTLRTFPLNNNGGRFDELAVRVNNEIAAGEKDAVLTAGTAYSQIGDVVKKCNGFSKFSFDSVRTGMYGGVAGVTIAKIVGGCVGSVIPIVGTVIGSLAGMTIASIWGAKKALDLREQQELEKGVQQMRVAVSQTLNNFFVETQREVRYIFDRISEDTRSMLRKSVAEQHSALASRRNELVARAQSNISELEKQRKEIEALSNQAETIVRFVI